jgi:hypothetical protein
VASPLTSGASFRCCLIRTTNPAAGNPSRLRNRLAWCSRLISSCAASLALTLGYPATAAAEPQQPKCPRNTVTIGNQGQVVSPPAQNQICDDDETGLLGSVPVLGGLF